MGIYERKMPTRELHTIPLDQQLMLPDSSEESETDSKMSESGYLTESEVHKSHDLWRTFDSVVYI